jgi:heterogeneous nuclear rnp K-like protein
MSASPTSATAPSQKRPLEEPSSPGSGEQPDAKRPALDKVIKSEEHGTAPAVPSVPPPTEETTVKPEEADTKEKAEQNGTTDHQGDTILPDAPASGTQPIQSTSSVPNRSTPTSVTAPQDESDWLHMRAVISSAEAATVIGKGGENVTTIRNKSGAKCTVSDYSRGAIERILTVSGPVDAISKVRSQCRSQFDISSHLN